MNANGHPSPTMEDLIREQRETNRLLLIVIAELQARPGRAAIRGSVASELGDTREESDVVLEAIKKIAAEYAGRVFSAKEVNAKAESEGGALRSDLEAAFGEFPVTNKLGRALYEHRDREVSGMVVHKHARDRDGVIWSIEM